MPDPAPGSIVMGVLTMILVVAGCGGSPEPGTPDAGRGEEVYETACIACHAAGGAGIAGLGKPLANSEFVAGLTDVELATFIIIGRGTQHPENTSGIAMPPRGGRPNLSDAAIADVVAYLRTLQDG